jgi:hypothetical protein
MGEISITIPLAWIYIPLIFFISYYFLKFITIIFVRLYLKRKYYKVVRPEFMKLVIETYKLSDEVKKSGEGIDEREHLVLKVNDRMEEILPRWMKFGGSIDTYYSSDIDGSCFEDIEIAMKLPFPYWRTGVFYEPDENIVLDKEYILQESRENKIDDILND